MSSGENGPPAQPPRLEERADVAGGLRHGRARHQARRVDLGRARNLIGERERSDEETDPLAAHVLELAVRIRRA